MPSHSRVILVCLFAYLALLGRMEWSFVRRTQPISPVGAPEEQLGAIQTATNFIDYGFFTHLLLTDYATSRDPAGHPFVYTHMPSGQNVLLAVLMKLGLDLTAIRFFFIGISFLGLFFFFLLFAELSGSEPVALIAVIAMSFSCEYFLSWSDQICHAFFWLAYALSTLHYLRYVRAGGKSHLRLSLCGLALSLLTVYVTTFSILGTVLLFHFLLVDRSPRSREYLRKAAILSICLIGLNVARNACVLGLSTEAREILYTLSNRMTGWPSRGELNRFFAEHGIVLWGADGSSKTPTLGFWIVGFVRDAGGLLLAFLLYAAAGLFFHRRTPWAFLRSGFVTLIPAVGLLGWYLVFPAHGRGYFLPYLEGVILGFLALTTGNLLLLSWQAVEAGNRAGLSKAVLTFLSLHFVLVIAGLLLQNIDYWQRALSKDFNRDQLASLGHLPDLDGKVTWTNLNPQALSFFTRSEIVGNCTTRALRERDLSGCFAIFRKDWKKQSSALSRPDYILYSHFLVAGNMDCRPGLPCEDELTGALARTARLKMKTDHWLLYEIPHPAPSTTHAVN